MTQTPNYNEAEFIEWFVKNYPPNTIISDPNWHAPRVLRAARRAIESENVELKRQLAERDRQLAEAQSIHDSTRRQFEAELKHSESMRLQLAEAQERIKYYESITTGAEHRVVESAVALKEGK